MRRISSPLTLVIVIALVIGLAVISDLIEGPADEAEEPNAAEEIASCTVFTAFLGVSLGFITDRIMKHTGLDLTSRKIVEH